MPPIANDFATAATPSLDAAHSGRDPLPELQTQATKRRGPSLVGSAAAQLTGRSLLSRWWWLVAGVGAAVALVGFQRFSGVSEPERVVREFVEAIRSGDHAAALNLLAPEQAAAARLVPVGESREWDPSPDLRCKIERVEESGDFAVIDVSLVEHGYALKPEISLSRDAQGAWKIVEIGNLQIDPRWVRQQQQVQAEADERLARDLESSLKNRPGVMVERDVESGKRRL